MTLFVLAPDTWLESILVSATIDPFVLEFNGISKINLDLISAFCKNGQPSNKHTRLIKGDTWCEQKKSGDTSRADTTDLWRFKKVALLAKLSHSTKKYRMHKIFP